MKVLVVGTGGSIVSGISTATDEMARTLASLGHGAERLDAGVRMRRRANRLNVENLLAVLADSAAVGRRAWRGRADVVWIHAIGVPTLPALRALAMVAAARVTGRLAVVQFHAFGLERTVAEGSRRLRAAVRAIAALAGAMVVVHEEAAEALRAVATGSPVHVLPNWVQVPDEVTTPSQQPPLRLVFVGGLVGRKGVPQLLEAMRALNDLAIELRLVGGAGEDGPAALEGLIVAAGDLVSAGCVGFAGELDGEGVRAELRAAHLLVLPSRAEGMPIAMLEAMAEGRAVLVSDAGNMRSVVEAAGCGWVLPDCRPETIASRLRWVAEHPVALAEASARAGRTAAALYSPAAQHPRIEAVLTSLGK
ncbi:MAG: glycosyltransferase family 4 protein [Acidimicrobiales bacterium]